MKISCEFLSLAVIQLQNSIVRSLKTYKYEIFHTLTILTQRCLHKMFVCPLYGMQSHC